MKIGDLVKFNDEFINSSYFVGTKKIFLNKPLLIVKIENDISFNKWKSISLDNDHIIADDLRYVFVMLGSQCKKTVVKYLEPWDEK